MHRFILTVGGLKARRNWPRQVSRAIACIALPVLMLQPLCAGAQVKYPERPIRLLVGSQAGGASDVVARKLAAQLGPLLGQPLVIENKTGAGGVLAGLETARAAADGYVLHMGTTSTTILGPLMQAAPAFNVTKDFTAINVVGSVPIALFIHPAVDARTLPQLVSLIKKSAPGRFSYGSGGPGTTSNLSVELLKKMAGDLDILHVPYKGGPAMAQAVMAGEVQMAVDGLVSLMALQQAGRIRILAVLSEKRSDLAPDIPTAAEVGLKDLIAEVSLFLLAPANLPKPVVDTLFAATSKVVSGEAYRAEILQSKMQPLSSPSQEAAAAYVRDESERWRGVLARTGAKSN